MIHFTCDRCRESIDPEQDLRYVVRMEVQAAMEPMDCEEPEDDRDHLLEIHEIIERLDDEDVDSDIYHKKRFDLCCKCYRDFVKNPLGQREAIQVEFSEN